MKQPDPYLFFKMKFLSKIFFFYLLVGINSSVFADNAKTGMNLFESGKYEQAMTYFLKQDAQRNAEVLNHIGYMYDNGLGVGQNPKLANQWYRKASEKGFPAADFNIGLSFESGSGVKKDINEAIKWYLKAAEQGYPDAESKMGYLTVTGKGVKQDFKQAMQWYRRAVEHGSVHAISELGVMYAEGHGVKKDKTHAVQYYIMGAEKGNVRAQFLLAEAYRYGRGIKNDDERSLYWYKKAAENGSADAYDALGSVYANEQLGQKKDRHKAGEMVEKAIEIRKHNGEGDPDARRRLRFFGVKLDD